MPISPVHHLEVEGRILHTIRAITCVGDFRNELKLIEHSQLLSKAEEKLNVLNHFEKASFPGPGLLLGSNGSPIECFDLDGSSQVDEIFIQAIKDADTVASSKGQPGSLVIMSSLLTFLSDLTILNHLLELQFFTGGPRLNRTKLDSWHASGSSLSDSAIREVSDLVDAKIGLPSTSSQCMTCGSTSVKECDGHFGVIKLPLAVYHPYLLPEIVHILNQICPGCKSFRKKARTKRRLFHSVRKKLLLYIRLKLSRLTRKILSGGLKDDIPYLKMKKHLSEEVGAIKNKSLCKYCAGSSIDWYPSVKFRISNRDVQGRKGLSIVAEVNEKLPKQFSSKSFSELLPKDFWNFIPKYHKQQRISCNCIYLSPWQ
ncbi:hypothetical protein HPP92_014991, partial [Vanilla planifolia]